MPKLQLDKHKNFIKVYVDYHSLSPKYVGEIKDNVLHVYDKDNIHEPSKSLGVDRLALESKEIQYEFISIGYNGAKRLTTRYYFYAHAKPYKLFNGREQLFLRVDQFGLKRAMKWEEYTEASELAQLDIFDIHEKTGYKDDNNTLLRRWEEAMKLVEIYENQTLTRIDL